MLVDLLVSFEQEKKYIRIIINIIFLNDIFYRIILLTIFITVCDTLGSILLHYVMDFLENVSILHVLLLILLRLWTIRYPMTRTGPLRFRNTLLIATWIGPIVFKLPLFLFLYLGYHGHQISYVNHVYMNIQFHMFSTISVLSIVILYVVMIFTIRNKRRENRQILNQTKATVETGNDRKTTLLITRLVAVIIFFYVPYVGTRSKEYFDDVKNFAIHQSICRIYLDFTNEVIIGYLTYDMFVTSLCFILFKNHERFFNVTLSVIFLGPLL